MNSDKEIAYQENLAKSRAISGDAATFFAEYQAQKLAAWLPENINKPVSILDFGCGDGIMASIVQHIFVHATIYGIDPSHEQIEFAKEVYEGIQFSTLSEALEVPDDTFDIVYATDVFHHIDPEHHANYCAELLRVLKPGGILIIFELNPLNLATLYRFKTNPYEKDAQLMTPWYLTQLLRPYGNVNIRFFDFFPNFLHSLRPLESYLIWLPLGALYAVSITKK